MFRKVAAVYPLNALRLLVWFEGGEVKRYDMAPLVDAGGPFAALREPGLFCRVQVDAGGYGISWNDDLDLAGNELYDHGEAIDVHMMEKARIVREFVEARHRAGLSQGQLEAASGVRQPVIARLERGATSPQLDTVIKALAPLGKTLQVVDLSR